MILIRRGDPCGRPLGSTFMGGMYAAPTKVSITLCRGRIYATRWAVRVCKCLTGDRKGRPYKQN